MAELNVRRITQGTTIFIILNLLLVSDTSGVQCELFAATRCILDFNFDRMKHLQSSGWPSMNTTALCGYV
uniref:Uncharacterized protein n=1 Tax=Magallana gigas TaxID=29159 RepID=K1QM80_MAGGI